MWHCKLCGCQNIAESVDFCPQCLEPRKNAEAASIEDAYKAAGERANPAQDEGEWTK